MEKIKIGIIGCGNMGMAIVNGLVKNKVTPPGYILVNDKDNKKTDFITAKSKIKKSTINNLVKSSKYIILAVKPQDSGDLLREISSHVNKSQVILSIMAGVTIKRITKLLGKNMATCRAMPNMAALVGKSVTSVSFNSRVRDKKTIIKIFGSIGTVFELDESKMDAVTALSGSGPAYIFYFTSALIDGGVKAGINRCTAENLAIDTVIGAAGILSKKRSVSIKDLIRKVASKGGTTEAAIKEFEDKKLKSIIGNAVLKAKSRSKELSKG